MERDNFLGVITKQKEAEAHGSNVKFLIEREDGEYVFRLHRNRVYYINSDVLKLAAHIKKDDLISAVTCFIRPCFLFKVLKMLHCLKFKA